MRERQERRERGEDIERDEREERDERGREIEGEIQWEEEFTRQREESVWI